MPNGRCAGLKGRYGTYDTLDRLDTASGRFGDRDYALNRNGNRTQLVADGEPTVTAYPKNSNRKRKNKPSSDTFWTYKHDANGSITAKTSTVGAPDLGYGYDARNRLTRATSDDGSVTVLGEYAYNGLGQRVRKTVDGEVFEYRYGLDGELLAILDDTGQPVREFVYLNGQPLAIIDLPTDALYYVHNDHLGTPRAMSDETGTRVWTAVYDPFGAATVDEDPDQDGIPVTLNLRFPGQYYDQETGLHYNYYRTYDPSTGRYLESDPIGLQGGLNTYGYVSANPLSYVDPFGLLEFKEIYECLAGAEGVSVRGCFEDLGRKSAEEHLEAGKEGGEELLANLKDGSVQCGNCVAKCTFTAAVGGSAEEILLTVGEQVSELKTLAMIELALGQSAKAAVKGALDRIAAPVTAYKFVQCTLDCE